MIRLTAMRGLFFLTLVGTAALGQGLPDRAFQRVPFEQWLKGGDQTRLRWSMRTVPATLSIHQRMVVRFVIEVDGGEFTKRPGGGRLISFLEIRDHDGQTFQMHRRLNAKELGKPGGVAAVNVFISAFVTPGDYPVAAAIYDARTKQHSLKQMTLHVPEPPRDPLPGYWAGLPHVEFLVSQDRPDVWFLPEIVSRAKLAAKVEHPVRIEVIANESPSEANGSRVGLATRRGMGLLVPALKVLSQIEGTNVTLNVTMLDLDRRKVSFAQEDVHTLDWTGLRAMLTEKNPNVIDVHALEKHEQNAQFFVSEVRKRLEGTETNGDVPLGIEAEPARVLIVLSGPMTFAKGQDLRPIEATPEPGSHVYYIRLYPSFSSGRGPVPVAPPPAGVLPPLPSGRSIPMEDSLGGTLKPLAPRIFNVTTPMEFRKALGTIMSEISQIK